MGSSRTVEGSARVTLRSEEHTSELQSQSNLVCRLLLEKKKYSNTFQPFCSWLLCTFIESIVTELFWLSPSTTLSSPVRTYGHEYADDDSRNTSSIELID